MSTHIEEALPDPEVLQALWMRASDLVAVVTPEGTFRYTSPSYWRVLGYAPQDLRGTSVFDRVHPEDRTRVTAAFVTAAGDPATPVTATFRYRHADGSWRTIEATGSNQQREAAIRGFLVIGRDITARVQAEECQHLLLDAVPLPVWSVTAAGEVAEVNAAWVTYTGLTREQTRGRGWVDAMLPDDIARARERWQRAQVTGESYEIEFRVRRAADGAYRWHLVRITPLRDATEQLVGWLATALDIDDRKRTEEERDRLLVEMHAARDWLQQVLDTLPEGILIANTAGRVVLVNRAAQELLGGDLAGQRVPVADDAAGAASDVRHLDGSPYPATERPLQRALRQRETMHGDRHLVRRADTGHEIPVLMNSAPLCDASGTITGAIAVFQDISMLRDIERTQEEFLSSVAHDLKTPLTSIRGHAELARRKLARLPDAAPSLRHLAQIEAGTLRMARLIDELVDVTRAQMGEALDLDLQPVDLVALVRGVVAEYAGLTAHHLSVTTALPELWATVDAARIERVVSNLLSNAVKYSPHDGDVVVHLARADGAAGPEALLAVQDRGVGIPSEDLPHIFERFRRAQNVVGRVHGTGIGLASVRQIVEQHGGTVQVESVLGAGSTFTVRLPLGAPAQRGGTEAATAGRGRRQKDRRSNA